VCTENVVRIDPEEESLNVGDDDRAVILLPDAAGSSGNRAECSQASASEQPSAGSVGFQAEMIGSWGFISDSLPQIGRAP
jgi:hypothetical protein